MYQTAERFRWQIPDAIPWLMIVNTSSACQTRWHWGAHWPMLGAPWQLVDVRSIQTCTTTAYDRIHAVEDSRIAVRLQVTPLYSCAYKRHACIESILEYQEIAYIRLCLGAKDHLTRYWLSARAGRQWLVLHPSRSIIVGKIWARSVGC